MNSERADMDKERAFEKMAESIIRRYRLYIPDEDFNDTFNDVLSYLITKADKYNPSKGTRAYSYYGNICKNYLIGRKESYEKSLIRNPSYDLNEEEYTNNARYTNKSDKGERIATNAVGKMENIYQPFTLSGIKCRKRRSPSKR